MTQTTSPQLVATSRSQAGISVLDVRNPDEFAAGHIAGARLIPLPQLPNRMDDLNFSDRIYVVCESGSRATEAARHLALRGYDVQAMVGGMSAWRSAGLPTVPGMLAMA